VRDCDSILLIEDSEEDYILLKRAFQRVSSRSNLFWVTSGAEARLTVLPDRRPPSFVLLDLHVPTANASFDFIRWARTDPIWKRVPIVLFTGDISPTDLDRAYELGINSCLKKPHEFDELVIAVEALLRYWCRTVELPVVN